MEAIMLRGSSLDQSISPHKPQIRNPRKIHHHNHPFISNHSDNFSPPNLNSIGLLPAPPSPFLSHSYLPFLLQQPPLLPLPAANHRLSPAAGKKPNGGKNRTRDTKNKNRPKKLADKPPERVVGSPIPGRLRPDPKDRSNNVAKVVNKPVVSSSGNNMYDGANNQVDLFSGTEMFTISPPPPSSLPLPSFSLKPKLSCRTAAAVDAGATDDLRRLLRLR